MSLVLSGCKKHFSLTEAEEIAMGQKAMQVLESRRGTSDAAQQDRVQRIGTALTKTTKTTSTRRRLTWKFSVLKLPVAAAFALPGGNVIVSADLVQATPDDQQLAALLAHEVAHVEAKDFVALLHREKDARVMLTALSGGLTFWELSGDDRLVRKLALKPLWRPQEEAKADLLAVRLLQEAGYEPQALAAVLQSQRDAASARPGTASEGTAAEVATRDALTTRLIAVQQVVENQQPPRDAKE